MEKRLQDYYDLMKARPHLFSESKLISIEKDEKEILDYEKKTGLKIGVVYQSPYSMLVVDLIREKKGGHYTYERILPTVEQGAVVALAKYQNKFVLLHQYRHSLRDYQYACPRGFGEKGISAEDNLKKEIREELGGTVLSQKHIGCIVADSGLCGNMVDVFLCDVDVVTDKQGHEGIESIILLNEHELEQWIQDSKITDGFTLSAYGLYKARYRE